jgi:alanyl-tRNA synthetase
VTADRLRFDFSHPKPVSAEELEKIEAQVNQDHPPELRHQHAPAADRSGHCGGRRSVVRREVRRRSACAFDGHGFGQRQEVIRSNCAAAPMCYRLGDIGLFTILAESAVAAGVRRIEALTSEHARRYLSGQAEIAREAASAIKTPIGELPARVTQLSEERRKLERDLAEAKKQLALAGPAKGGDDSETVAGRQSRAAAGRRRQHPRTSRAWPTAPRAQVGSGVVAFVAAADGKVSIVAGVTDDLTARISAVDLVRVAAEALGGKGGGGRPDMAQAGGPDNGNPQASLDAIRKKLGELAPA